MKSGSRGDGLTSLSIRRPVGVLALTLVVLVVGLYFSQRLSLDLLPQIIYPQVRASVDYPGVAPEVVEEQITRVLESSLATTEGVTQLESTTSEGQSEVDLVFDYGTDINFALQDASKNLDRIRAQLPEEARAPTVRKFDPSQIPIYEVGFSSGARSPVELRDWVATRLQPQLLTVPGVASVDVSGGLVREIQVTLDQERLRSYGITVADVIARLRAENQDVGLGRVASNRFEAVGKTEGRFRTVEDIGAVLIPVPGTTSRVPLADVARVADTHAEQRVWVRLDGQTAVRIAVRKQPDANTVAVAEGIAARIRSLRDSRFIPEDIADVVIADQSFFIRNAVAGVRSAAGLGALLSMLVVLLFLGSLRKTLVIGTAIPLAILATFMLMGLSGLTLNIMSLGGLALGVGMLIDNSIVMLENIFRHRALGRDDAEQAAHRGAAEVASAVTASTLTNLASVVPFLLISGLAALIFRELILTVSFANLAALIVSLTLVPMLSARLGQVRHSSGLERSRPIVAFDAWLRRLTEGYRRAAAASIRRRSWVMLGAAAALLAVFVGTRDLGYEFLPTVDDGQVTVTIRLAPGTAPETTDQVASRIEDTIRGMPHVRHLFTTVGGQSFGGSTSVSGGRGSIAVQLAPAAERRDQPAVRWVAELQRRLDALGIAGAQINVRPPRIRGLRTNTANADLSVSVQGEDLAELQRVGAEVQRRLRAVPGLRSVEASTDEASPQIQVRIDRERAADLGLDVAQVGQTVRTAIDGSVATRFTEGSREYDVRVRLPRETLTSPEDLGAVALFAARGAPVYLSDVADVRLGTGPTSILRVNQSRQLRITADVDETVADVGSIANASRSALRELELPEGIALVFGGEEQAARENQRDLTLVILLAVFLVLVVMAIQYESVSDPLAILVTVPLALIGVGLALKLTGLPTSAPVLLGVILLTGIVVNNAILLVEYVEQGRREKGLELEEAVVEAGATRLRPILMTSATTVVGMFPLAAGLESGSELMRPLAVTVVGGLTVSTVLTLFVIPCVYLSVQQVSRHLRQWIVGRRPVVAEVE